MRETGFYREMQVGGTDRPSMVPELGSIDPADKSQVVDYLEAGNALVTAAGAAVDGLDAERGPVATLGVLTDGEWVWPAELAYYVRTYDLGVEADFLAHMRASNWSMPHLDVDELVGLLGEGD